MLGAMPSSPPHRQCTGTPPPPKDAAARQAPPKIRKSKSTKWRAGVLIGVHAIVAIHIAHWTTGGKTLSPLEPSESMEFCKRGLVNAGLIFFTTTILSTLVLGRF